MTDQFFTIRPTVEADWERVRDLRLEMLADTPIAYVETRETALAHSESEWRMRANRGLTEHGTFLVAVDRNNRWIGTMSGYVPETGQAQLVGVYVAPDVRGRGSGVTDALLLGIEDWARTQGDSLALHVHEDNARAIAAYERRRFAFTGRSEPYNLDPGKLELEMVKNLND